MSGYLDLFCVLDGDIDAFEHPRCLVVFCDNCCRLCRDGLIQIDTVPPTRYYDCLGCGASFQARIYEPLWRTQ